MSRGQFPNSSPSGILYGHTPSRGAAPDINSLEIKKSLDGSIEYYDYYGQLVKLEISASVEHNYRGEKFLGPCVLHFFEGKLHREDDQPAVEYEDGTEEWWLNGGRHRDNDQPAVITAYGYKEWWVNGEKHRENDQPAVVYQDGSRSWWFHGVRHRDGNKPAVLDAKGREEYWLHGVKHRDDGPAIIHNDYRQYYHHGRLHREDGPAVFYASDEEHHEQYYRHGQLHRDDGPAMIHSNGATEYWRNGIRYCAHDLSIEYKKQL